MSPQSQSAFAWLFSAFPAPSSKADVLPIHGLQLGRYSRTVDDFLPTLATNLQAWHLP